MGFQTERPKRRAILVDLPFTKPTREGAGLCPVPEPSKASESRYLNMVA